MRKLTPEERAAKKAAAHVHDENCGHLTAPAEAPVATADVAVQPTEAEDKPKRGRRKAEEAPTEEAVAEEAPVAEAPAEEATVAEAPVEETPDPF